MQEVKQDELNFAEPAHPTAVASQSQVEKVVGILEVHGLLTAADICEKLGRQPNENRKRQIRAVARAAFPGILSFSIPQDDGSRFEGYKLLRQCSIEESWTAVRAIEAIERDAVKKKKLLLDAIHTGKVGGPACACQPATSRQTSAP